MLKKIMAVGAALAFFACSNDSTSTTPPNSNPSQGGGTSSSSQGGGISSPSQQTEAVLIFNGNSGGLSALFNTYPYGYTLRANQDENLTQFWNCSPEQSTMTLGEIADCRLPQTGAILQNLLTTRDSPLHYIINNMLTDQPTQRAIKLESYNLTGAGDQAALGLDASQAGLEALAGVVAFTYYYNGGAHKFRIAANDADFWYAEVSAQTEEGLVTINTSDLKGMGSFAENETPFDISKAAKFLWVVEFDANPANNTGSLLVYLFNALVEK